MKLHLSDNLKTFFPQAPKACFGTIMALDGKVYRAIARRETIEVTLGQKTYFIKKHFGIGWHEVVKNLCYLRLPVLGAMQEVRAIKSIGALGIEVPRCVAYGVRGNNPATQQSFIITEKIDYQQTLEDLTASWKNSPPALNEKRELIKAVANIANKIHSHGINHRDFYLCHFLKKNHDNKRLILMDLHRVQIRKALPERWCIKDLAGLYFSAMDIGLTHNDLLYFIKCYSGRESFRNAIWQKVSNKAKRLYQKHQKHQR